jgi:hypothetical protein
MVRQLAAKRIAIVHDSRVYGKGLAELTRQSLEQLGTPPVLFEGAQPGQLVFADLIQRLRGAEIYVLSKAAIRARLACCAGRWERRGSIL